MSFQNLQPFKIAVILLACGVALVAVGVIGSFAFTPGNDYAEQIALSWGLWISKAITTIGLLVILAPLMMIAVEGVTRIGLRAYYQEVARNDDAKKNNFGGYLPAYAETRLDIPFPDKLIYALPGETFQEVCTRYAAHAEGMRSNKTACILILPYKRDQVELFFPNHDKTISLPRLESGLVEFEYVNDFKYENENYPEFMIFVKSAVSRWAKVGEKIKNEMYTSVGVSELLNIGRRGVITVFVLLFSLSVFAGIKEDIAAVVPSAVLTATVPTGTNVVFSFSKISVSRKGDGKSNAIELLEKGVFAFDNSADYGHFNGLNIGGTIYKNTTVPTVNAAVTANDVPRKSLSQNVQEIDQSTTAALQSLETGAKVVTGSKTFEMILSLLGFFTIISALISRTAFGESRISADGITIFGNRFLQVGSAFRFISFVLFTSFIVGFLGNWYYNWVVYKDATAGFAYIFSGFTFGLLMLLVLGLICFWLVGKAVPDPKVDRNVNGSPNIRQVGGGQTNRMLNNG